MHVHTETAPFPRLRRPLNITVVGELGLTDGVAVFLDEGRVDFLVRERLPEHTPQLVRIDLGGLGRNADLSVRLVRVIRGRDTPFRKGWFHSGTWEPVHSADRDTVETFLERSEVQSRSGVRSVTSMFGSQTMTTLGGGSVSQVDPVKASSSWTPDGTRPTPVEPDPADRGGRARVRRSMRRGRERIARERTEAVERSAGTTPSAARGRQDRRTAVPATPAARPGSRTSTLENHRKPVKPADLVMPILSDVGGASVMATFAFGHRLERAMNIGDSWFRLVLERPRGLDAYQAIQLVLQLPDGSFVQAPAKVLRAGPDRVLVEAAHADPMTLAILRRSI